MQPDALSEQLERSAPQPARPQCRSGKPAARSVALAIVNRLLEQRDPRLVPEQVAEKGGRVAGYGQRGCACQLDGVVCACEVGRIDPKVYLE